MADFAVELDAVDDLLVAGAAAEMRLERLGDFVARRFVAIVAQADGPHRHAGDAEAALHAAAADERLGDLLAMLFVEAFERGDRFALGLLGLERAGEHRFAVHQHRAAAALGLRLAAVLGRGDAELVAEHVEQRPAGFGELDFDVLVVDAAGEDAAGAAEASEVVSNRRHRSLASRECGQRPPLTRRTRLAT